MTAGQGGPERSRRARIRLSQSLTPGENLLTHDDVQGRGHGVIGAHRRIANAVGRTWIKKEIRRWVSARHVESNTKVTHGAESGLLSRLKRAINIRSLLGR